MNCSYIKPRHDSTGKDLSQRELEVLRLICSGLKPKQIALDLNLSVKTINTYNDRMREKFGAKTMEHMVFLFAKTELAAKLSNAFTRPLLANMDPQT